ncbi:Kelch-type beta propeller [Arabidopsis thaliana x Arabidopsis arenosa]|uniref:Kelch-type beta propeller n=1 Tax=Arabidopsis thaliana x Arabidopsis arenosa TaxID=1240361 RepID=A0A8T2A6Y5_9BRAS|nr:Kelch-type beta propeller [Arabidopsis thaliana x Arabidopsis arenosa]
MYVVPELLEEIFLQLPLRSILRFKTVSTQWRSILESKRFAERRRRMSNHQQIPKILAVRDDRTESQFQGDEEVKMVYLQCEAAATQLSMTCDGLVCIPIPGYVNVLNPCPGELLRFPSGPNPVNTSRYDRVIQGANWWDFFPGYWAMGFGKDKVNGSYKIVRMFYDTDQFEILDLNIGKWRTLPNPPPYYVEARHHSAFVNGSIYWFELLHGFKILALDLHTEQFHDVPTPRASPAPAPLVNLEDRLAMVCGYAKYSDAKVDIWTMDTQEETWTKTYSIRLFPSYLCPNHVTMKCIPLMVSKNKGIFTDQFYDTDQFEILDLNIGKWRTLPNPPPYYVEARHHSAFVNGSIYWFELLHGFKILALDLHTEQFHDVPTPRASPAPAPLVNLEDRLAMVCGYAKYSDAKVDIWTMDTQEETWTKTYSIRLFPSYLCPNHVTKKCIPLMVSKQGNIYFYDSEKRLFKYYPETDQVCCIAKHICVLSPFVENMIPLGHPKTMTYPPGFQKADSWISKLCRRIELPTTILLSTTVVALVIFRFSSRS